MKFDIVCDKWSVITDKSRYEISKRSPCCCWLWQWAILPQFRTSSSFAGKHFFWNLACGLHVIISRQIKCKTFVIFKSFQRVLYCIPNLFKYFKLGQNTSLIFRVQQASEIMIVLKRFFPNRFSIKFCIRKSNRFYSLHWASPLKMAQS